MISAGADRGKRDLKDILRIGINAIHKFEGYDELKEVALIAWSGLGNKMTPGDADVLIEVCREMGLKKKKKGLISKIKTPFKSPKYTPYEQEKREEQTSLKSFVKTPVSASKTGAGGIFSPTLTEKEVKHLLGKAPRPHRSMKNTGTSNDLSTSSEMITKEKSNKSSLNPNNLLRLSSELVTADESLCLLGRLVANAAARRDLPFIPSSDPILNQDLHLQNPLVDPSGITLDTYFRRDGVYRQDKRDDAYPAVASEREENQSISNVGNFDTIRWRLNAVVECLDAPLELPSLYVNEIKTETMLGEGFYGDVRLGIDIVIGKKFAIKMIKPIVFEQALASRLETIQKSFQNEIKVSACCFDVVLYSMKS